MTKDPWGTKIVFQTPGRQAQCIIFGDHISVRVGKPSVQCVHDLSML